jgi:hypothetical protein
MDAEQIVRALAAEDAPTGFEEGPPKSSWCLFCSSIDDGIQLFPDAHAPTCPWRQASEWVEANPSPT